MIFRHRTEGSRAWYLGLGKSRLIFKSSFIDARLEIIENVTPWMLCCASNHMQLSLRYTISFCFFFMQCSKPNVFYKKINALLRPRKTDDALAFSVFFH